MLLYEKLSISGLLDYEAALKIDPNNEKLKEDAKHIRETIEGPKPS